ncbi:MAG: hypothetical protein ACKV2O_19720 [Acidimicrobiales bacterium]
MADLAARVGACPGVLQPGETVLAAARVFSTGYLKLRVLLFMLAGLGAFVMSQAIDENASIAVNAAAGVAAFSVAETLLNALHRAPQGFANRMVLACTEHRLLFVGTSSWTGLPTGVLTALAFSDVRRVTIEQRRVSFWRFGYLVLHRHDGSETDVETTARGAALLAHIDARV